MLCPPPYYEVSNHPHPIILSAFYLSISLKFDQLILSMSWSQYLFCIPSTTHCFTVKTTEPFKQLNLQKLQQSITRTILVDSYRVVWEFYNCFWNLQGKNLFCFIQSCLTSLKESNFCWNKTYTVIYPISDMPQTPVYKSHNLLLYMFYF